MFAQNASSDNLHEFDYIHMLEWIKNIFSAKQPQVAPSMPVAVAPPETDDPLQQSMQIKERGDAALDQGDWHSAVNYFQQAVALSPLYAPAHGNLGLALLQLRQFDAARHHGKQAVSINPELFNSYYLLAMIARQQGNFAEARFNLICAIAVRPDFAEAYHELGTWDASRGDRTRAQENFQHALAIDPENVPSLFHLASLLEFQGRRIEAISYYRRALALAPEINTTRISLLHQLMQTCDWSDIDMHIDAARRAVREASLDAGYCDSPFAFLTLPGSTAAEQKRCAEKWAQVQYRKEVNLRASLAFSFAREANSKPHIAYLSADFCDHATSRLMAEIFELHDRQRFKISAYSYSPADNSSMSARMHAAFDSFIDISGDTDVEAAQRIYHDRVDILVDLKGYTGDTRSAILALCPAPIQVNYLGYPGTMGADFVDYLIADRFVIPESAREHYTETVAYLPNTYQPNDRTRTRGAAPSRKDVGLPETGLVFCCFNQTYKITPDIFSIWCELLNQVPGSMLWLIASDAYTQGNLQREAGQRGVDPQRLIFAPRVAPDAHLARHQCVDLFLDTIPYNAHTTCSDALWMGVPVVTLAGDTFPARVAGSLLRAMGLPELITESHEAYLALALELAQDESKLAAVRAKIAANRDTAPLFDSRLFTLDLEGVYQSMLDAQEERRKAIRIVIISPFGYAHSHAFDEIAESLMYALQGLGHTVTISRNAFDRHGRNIIFGANLLGEERIAEIPPNSVIYNLEQVYPDSPWMTPGMLQIFRQFEVWDYSARNVESLRRMVPDARVKYVKIGFVSQMARIAQLPEQDIDVLFYGSVNARRSAVLDELRQRGVRVEAVFGVYGAERDALISRAKLVLNMRLYDSDIFEIVRVSYLLANKKAVVSEWSERTDIEDDMREAVALSAYENLADTCISLLADKQKREALAERGFAAMSARDAGSYLSVALSGSVQG